MQASSQVEIAMQVQCNLNASRLTIQMCKRDRHSSTMQFECKRAHNSGVQARSQFKYNAIR
eukprot:652951-Amphidinium_carterae.1